MRSAESRGRWRRDAPPDAGDISPVSRRTLIALWNQGLIEFALSSGWRLTRHGRLAMDTGRLMLSNRSPE